jgi:signal transduction histidine kinase
MNKRNLLYYLFAAFIVAIFLWWWTLLFQKNQNVYREKLVLYDLIIDIDTSETTMQLYDQEVASLNARHKRQKTMIAGEGLTFLFLLILGIIRLNRYFQKEIGLARQQSNFLLSITHELRSPLASVLLNIQTMQKRRELPPEKRDILLASSKTELSRLEELVEKLLFAARIEDTPVAHMVEKVDISTLYRSLLDGLRTKCPPGITIRAGIEDDLAVKGDTVLLSSIFVNLTDNAVKYCPEGGSIDIDCRRANGKVVLTVANDGQSIPKDEKDRIWEKFYRIGDEHTRSATGTGLGLYIVRRIAEAHKGSVSVADKSGGGAIFAVELPHD